MSDDLDIDALQEGDRLEVEGTPVIEAVSQIVVPKKGGVIQEDGSVRIAVIRPCVSRGRRIRGLPPRYSPQMLERDSRVFEDWPMFVDHLPPEVASTMAKKGRGVLDLGGRIAESRWDPNLVLSTDGDRGHEKGGVVAKAFPAPAMRALIESDPLMMRTSINAYPTGAVVAMHGTRKVALIEGIRKDPVGSVDWVVRAGAGGQVLTEDEAHLVSVLESFYADAQMDLASLTNEQLLEHVTSRGLTVPTVTTTGTATGTQITAPAGLSEEDVEAKIAEAQRESDERAEEREQEIREEADKAATAKIQAVGFQTLAHQLIEQSGLKGRAKADLRARYSVAPDGTPLPALCVEAREADGDTEAATAIEVLTESVNDDIKYVRDILNEELGDAAVRNEGRVGDGGNSTSTDASELRESLAGYGIPVPKKEGDE